MTPPNDKLPPRAYLRPDHNLGMKRYDAVEYLSLAEHQRILAEKLAEARAEAFEEAAWVFNPTGPSPDGDIHDMFERYAEEARAGEGKEE